jgi:predicted TIM-barrel fold metal-dependent hydrolase
MAAPNVITIEEHFWTPELNGTGQRQAGAAQRLSDMGELRIREMDEAGIDLQVMSETAPATQNLDPESAVRLARRSNDFLHEAVRAHPDRFAGFATLPTPDPAAAADELERAVTRLGFKGAMIMGLTHGRFLDEKDFWPIFERAAALDVPIYIHPGPPHRAVVEAYYKDFPDLVGAPLAFTVETLTHAVRLIVRGVFDAYPGLKVIVGHLGEALPFLLWCIDNTLARHTRLARAFSDYARQHFYVTTSGAFSNTALQCTIAELGVEKILFAVDWPFMPNVPGRKFMDAAPISEGDRALIFGGNARKLLKL